MKKIIFILLLIVFLAIFCFFYLNFRLVSIDKKVFLAKRAVSQAELEKGLGNRKSLCQKCAMIFEFKKTGQYQFWMKDMRFDLDIIWINDGKIAYITKNVSFKSLSIINPQVNSQNVLEINAGLSDKYNFKIGDQVKIY
jgi:uncharacterized membrane protein (UPF0127 family)